MALALSKARDVDFFQCRYFGITTAKEFPGDETTQNRYPLRSVNDRILTRASTVLVRFLS